MYLNSHAIFEAPTLSSCLRLHTVVLSVVRSGAPFGRALLQSFVGSRPGTVSFWVPSVGENKKSVTI